MMRKPQIAGTWYPDKESELTRLISFDCHSPRWSQAPAVLLVPHAGYVYSGQAAADAYARLPADAYDRVIILAPSHHSRMLFQISPEPADDVETPFGPVHFSQKLNDALSRLPFAHYQPQAHAAEHAIDIQLPFVRHFLPQCELGALLVGHWDAGNESEQRKLNLFAEKFRELLTDRTLVIISTDFTHYGRSFGYLPFTENIKSNLTALDATMFNAFASNDNRIWAQAIHANRATICGASCMHLVLATLPQNSEFHKISYSTSADTTNDWSHVVGYTTAMILADWKAPLKKAVTHNSRNAYSRPAINQNPKSQMNGEIQPESQSRLSKEAGTVLLKIARQSITQAVSGIKDDHGVQVCKAAFEELQRHGGAFVTLKIQGQLRGCIGRIVADDSILRVVNECAVSAALRDPRFRPVRPEELPKLDYEVSILTQPVPIASIEEITPGRDGVFMHKNGHHAVFLPQVAVEQGWDRETMLSQLSIKAGLASDAWKEGAEFEKFQAQIFNETQE